MGESRQELVQWLNNLLQLNITKVEQCGTGAALCQVYDSIYMDVPMHKVKFNVNGEYAYVQNFKVLQSTFAKHQIDKPIPIEQLVKCKMQDNLEFLQWTKKFWDLNFPDHEYDAVARRKGRVEEEPRDARQRAQVADAIARDAGQRAAEQELRDDGGGRVRDAAAARRRGPAALGAEPDEDGQLDDEVGRAQPGLAARLEDGRQQRRDPLGVTGRRASPTP
ncbi:hypothetical protein NLG97_g4429 [Lecanicillium saksenae]|uniref:Uncharacterized protein n=1 Tax=Lecanicillium saksenae TaxID=468837 RepID=A0ACC1QYG7_9HYPO|nr:hypothetical protein NLG97_g4429 [Lecanicillium saksenae]